MKIALAALAFALVPPQADSLTLGVAKGTKLTKSSKMSMDTELKDASIRVGGRDAPPEVVEKFEMSSYFSNEEQVEDEYVSVDGARPTELVRHYLKATQVQKQHFAFPSAPPKDEDKTVESPLIDHAVVFTWDAKDEKYARAYKGKEGEAAWLEKLKAGMDFEQILPPGKVEVGDTWKLDAKDFVPLTSPGGSLSYPNKSKSDTNPFEDGLQGTLEARYDGKRKVDDRELAVIHLHADIHNEIPADESGEMPMTVEIAMELEGEYLWDVEHGHLASYELEGPARLTFSGSREIQAKDQKLTMELKFRLEGPCKLAVKIE